MKSVSSKGMKSRVSSTKDLERARDSERDLLKGNRSKQKGFTLRSILELLFQVELEDGEAESLTLLLLLYTLQGVPMGISASVSFILQEKGVSYAEQGTFSLASWPFSLKVLWAPIVDAVYFRRVGQRRTWLLPLQACVGVVLLYIASHVSDLLGEGDALVQPKVWPLTVIFFFTYFLLASQDIAVDGWAITMLSEKNVGLASTANATGQTAGFFISFTGYLVLNSWGLVGLRGFLQFWAIIFLFSAACVLLKREKPSKESVNVVGAYKEAVSILRIPSMLPLSFVLLTRSAAFAAAESLTQLRLLDKGVPKQHLATLSALLTPVNIVLPVFVAKWTSGPRPLDPLIKTFYFRAILSFGAAVLVATTPHDLGHSSIPWGFYTAVTIWLSIYSAAGTLHFVSVMSFFSRISDPRIGGTYMTFLNTISNLGSKWSSSAILFVFDAISNTHLECVHLEDGHSLGVCLDTEEGKAACRLQGGKCIAGDMEFYSLVTMSVGLGFLWVFVMRKRVDRLQEMALSAW
eukprot:CAMPEP_0118931294 /NCGR_PEP_ID=MMETSP1169-20130426/7681_1 /TAXON_ID=36882 /ORGANISM="Pyramimonas obovata, Strain CCMP722" /LENGTH=519 /DNA_ID=CAMNT_0006873775 /DNA_START=81 /DNA_END=1637 /DNA_ORIENTATION=-